MRRLDTKRRTEPRHVPNPHRPAVDEVDDLRRLTEAKLVRCEYSVLRGERTDVALPGQFGIGAELAAVQQHHRIAVTSFQITRDQAVDLDGSAVHRRHLIAIGFTGDPTAPVILNGGAISWNS